MRSTAIPSWQTFPPSRPPVDTAVTFQLTAIDVEGDPAYFLDQDVLAYYDLYVPFFAHPDLEYSVDFYTGLVTVSPTNGLMGTYPIIVGTAVYTDAIDYQVVSINIVPEPSTLTLAWTALLATLAGYGVFRRSVPVAATP